MITKTDRVKGKIFLLSGVFLPLLILFIFKYFNFFNTNFSKLASFLHWNYSVENLKIILPIGLSFFTFQSIGYVIDVYRGIQQSEKNPFVFALFVMFYPQLLAGPINRSPNLLHQFREVHTFNYQRVTDGIKLMLWGYFKKVVIADRLAILVNQVFNNCYDYSGFHLTIAAVFFTFQIYCDFSGYSDIAIGTAQVMGFKLMENFKHPYFSTSIPEFWRRWHISLSTWFKDYLYIPLGGNKVKRGRHYFNLFTTFIISGLWHGASWTFIFWGMLHGCYMLLSLWTRNMRYYFSNKPFYSRHPVLIRIYRTLLTFTLVATAWIFFKANTITDAFWIINKIIGGFFSTFVSIVTMDTMNLVGIFNFNNLGLSKTDLIIAFISILFMEFIHLLQLTKSIRLRLSTKPIWIRWSVYYTAIVIILILGVFDNNQFIYFQF